MTETELKKQLKEDLAPVYLLYGEESTTCRTLSENYVRTKPRTES